MKNLKAFIVILSLGLTASVFIGCDKSKKSNSNPAVAPYPGYNGFGFGTDSGRVGCRNINLASQSCGEGSATTNSSMMRRVVEDMGYCRSFFGSDTFTDCNQVAKDFFRPNLSVKIDAPNGVAITGHGVRGAVSLTPVFYNGFQSTPYGRPITFSGQFYPTQNGLEMDTYGYSSTDSHNVPIRIIVNVDYNNLSTINQGVNAQILYNGQQLATATLY